MHGHVFLMIYVSCPCEGHKTDQTQRLLIQITMLYHYATVLPDLTVHHIRVTHCEIYNHPTSTPLFKTKGKNCLVSGYISNIFRLVGRQTFFFS